ncbi:MAG: D-2-hydroxyacid dehydrogenase, partial [Chloroflexi bacterium]
VYAAGEIRQALGQADHVALCLPLTAATTALVGAAELRAMRPTAYIYNVGRGASLEPNALIQALQAGWIAGAGLDVTAPEPLPPDSPLWAMPNVILSQHTSGSSPYNADRITAIFAGNLARYLAGDPLQNVINPARGY